MQACFFASLPTCTSLLSEEDGAEQRAHRDDDTRALSFAQLDCSGADTAAAGNYFTHSEVQETEHTRLATLQPAASVHENGFTWLQPSPHEYVAPNREVRFRQRCSLDHGEAFGYWQTLRGSDADKLDEESWRVSQCDG